MEVVEAVSVGLGLFASVVAVGSAINGVKPRPECNVKVTNSSERYILLNPGVHICRGSCTDLFPPSILSSSSGSATFVKTPCTGRGFSATCTYDLFEKATKRVILQLALFFKVPYNQSLKQALFAVGIDEAIRPCNENLHKEMADEKDKRYDRGLAASSFLTLQKQHVMVRATMSHGPAFVVNVQVSDCEDHHPLSASGSFCSVKDFKEMQLGPKLQARGASARF